MPLAIEKANVLGIPVAKLDQRQLFDLVKEKIDTPQPQPFSITYVNAHSCNLFYSNLNYKNCLLKVDLIYTDGNGPRIAAWLSRNHLPPRITGADWIYDLCQWSGEQNIRLFFLGSKPGVAAEAAMNLRQLYPQTPIVGIHHGYWSLIEEEAMIEHINQLEPDILLIGMSSPLQENWMVKNLDRLHLPVVWCAGGIFDYASGQLPRTPLWMRRMGLEWFGRFLIEPRRLGARYLIGVPLFLLRAIWFALRGRFPKVVHTAP